MLNLINKYIIVILFSVIASGCFSQPVELKNNFDSGNIVIKDSLLNTIINGFYNYTQANGKFNYSQYFVGITFNNYSDSSNYIEMTLSNFDITSRKSVKPVFYGYAVRNNIYFIFWNGNKYIERNTSLLNPAIFNIASSKKYPSPVAYDPYRWEITFKGDKILSMSPKDTAEKYIISGSL